MKSIEVNITKQRMIVFDSGNVIREYMISTARNGAGEEFGSEKTPRGKHIVRAKIGNNLPINSVLVGRRPTGEIFEPGMRALFPDRDWILTRIFWLSGLEKGKNRLGNVDTMRRYIYIHGAPDDISMGTPGSRGCIRMNNHDIIELFELIPVGTTITIQ